MAPTSSVIEAAVFEVNDSAATVEEVYDLAAAGDSLKRSLDEATSAADLLYKCKLPQEGETLARIASELRQLRQHIRSMLPVELGGEG
ncbi:MAG TPA: hypothetical protein VEY08_05720 [Chloroflexia bacterium]|nr:hypothetical protein [Chloroflexia bacterium]